MTSKCENFPEEILRHFEAYLPYFHSLQETGTEQITIAALAQEFRFEQRQIRRELASLTGSGELRSTYDVADLIVEIERLLGFHNLSDVIVVGAGRVGLGLMKNAGFAKRDLYLGPLFDETARQPREVEGIRVLPLSQLEEAVARRHTHLGILATGKDMAQQVCEQMAAAGIHGIWNVSGQRVTAPQGVLVQSETFGEHEDIRGNENFVLSLVVLAKHLGQRMGW